MCLLSILGTLREGSGGVGTGMSHGAAFALRSSGCSDVLLEAGSAMTTGGVVL